MRFEIPTALAHRRGCCQAGHPGGKAGATRSVNLVETPGSGPATASNVQKTGRPEKDVPPSSWRLPPAGDHDKWPHGSLSPGESGGRTGAEAWRDGVWGTQSLLGSGGWRAAGRAGEAGTGAGWCGSHAFTLGERLRSRPRARTRVGDQTHGLAFCDHTVSRPAHRAWHACHLTLSVLG